MAILLYDTGIEIVKNEGSDFIVAVMRRYYVILK